jgi:hypothetical protein
MSLELYFDVIVTSLLQQRTIIVDIIGIEWLRHQKDSVTLMEFYVDIDKILKH